MINILNGAAKGFLMAMVALGMLAEVSLAHSSGAPSDVTTLWLGSFLMIQTNLFHYIWNWSQK